MSGPIDERSRRQELRRHLMLQLAEFSCWEGGDLRDLLRLPPSRISRGDGFVRQILTGYANCGTMNLRVEIASDQEGCSEGAVRVWVDVNDGKLIEAGELIIDGENVLIGNDIKSLGR
jgi:hypothetical protein